MNQKVLWKIEELWGRYRGKTITTPFDVSEHYDETGISLHHPRFMKKERFDPTPSESPVFVDDYGSYHGLLHCQCLHINGKLVYIVDNHNEMLYSLVEVYTKTKQKYDVLHIDAHPDDAVYSFERPKKIGIEEAAKFIETSKISDFFDAVSETNIIGNIHRITDSSSFEHVALSQNPFVLSLDIDIFGPEGDVVPLETKVTTIRAAWDRADVVCIATSPGFIDRDFANGIIEIMCG